MSPRLKGSLAALAVLSLLSAPFVGTGIAYADDTSTSTVQTDSSSDTAAAKAAADKKAADEAAQKKADEEAAAEAQAKADAEKKAQEEADAKKATATPSAEPSPSTSSSPAATPSATSPTVQVAAKAKVASDDTPSYGSVTSYLTKKTYCGAAGFDVHSDAPSKGIGVKYTDDGGGLKEEVYKPGEAFQANTSHTSLAVYVYLVNDPTNDANLSIPVLQGDDCLKSVTPDNPTQDGNIVTVPDTDCVVYTDQDGNILDSGPMTIKKDTTITASPDEGCRFPAGVTTTWTFKYTSPTPVLTKVTAVNGTFDNPCGPTFNLTFTPATTEGVKYNAVREENPPNTVKVTAEVTDSTKYVLSNPDWSQTMTDDLKACPVEKQYAVLIWSVNDYPTNSMWPQTLVDSVTGLDAPNLGYFDSLLKGKCVKYQVDVYHYDVKDGSKAKVDNLIATGHLYGSNNPPEPLISGGAGTAWKFYSNSDCTTYYDAPTIRVWDQKCTVGDQGVAQYTDGGFAVAASDKVTVVVTDSDSNVVTDSSSVKPGVYTVSATAPKGGVWNTLPDGWSYLDKTKTTIKMVVTVNAAKDCTVNPPPPNPSTYSWGQETWKCGDTVAITNGERIDFLPTWIEGAWVQVAQPPVSVQKSRPLTEEEIVKVCTPQPDIKVTYSGWIDGQWKCGDTQVLQTQVKTTTTTPYVIQWNEDGSYTFVLDTANAMVETETLYQYRQLKEDEITKVCTPQPKTEIVSTKWKDGDWKCGDTTVKQTRWTATWEIPYVIQWNEDGSYTFVLDYDHAVLLSNVKETRSRDLTADEIAPCNNGGSSGPKDGVDPGVPWGLGLLLAGTGTAFLVRRRMA